MHCALRPRPHISGYFWIRNFFFPDTASVHTHPANSTTNPDIFKSALQSGKNKTDNVWTGESGYFRIRRRIKFVSSLLPNNKARQQQQSVFAATIEGFMAHALNIFYGRGALGTWVNPDTIGCDWRGEFDLNTLRVDGELFESGKKKLRIQKYPDTCGRGPKSGISVRSFFHKDLHCGHFCELFEKCIHPQMFWVLDPGNLTFVSRKTAEILLSPS